MNDQDRENLKKLRSGEASSKSNPKSYWQKEDDENLTTLFRDGFGISEIALMMNRTERAIMQRIEHLKLYETSRKPYRSKKGDCSHKKHCHSIAFCPNCPINPAFSGGQ